MKFSMFGALLCFVIVSFPATAQDLAPGATSAARVLVVQAGPREAVRALQISPDGSRLASLSDDALQMWTRGGGLLWTRTLTEKQEALAWSSDGHKIAVGVGGAPGFYVGKAGDSAGALELDARNGAVLRTLLHGNNTVSRLVYAPDGRLHVVSSEGNIAWDEAGQQLKAAAPISHLPAVFDGTTLRFLNARGQTERQIALFEPRLKPKTGETYHAVTISPDGNSVFCARTDFPAAREDEDGDIEAGQPRAFLWRVERATGAVLTLRSGVKGAILSLACWPDGSLILGGASSDDPPLWSGELRFARWENGILRANWSAPQALQPPRNLQISPDGATLAVGGEDTAIRLWDLATGRLQTSLKAFSSGLQALDFSPDGRQIAALDYDDLFVWDIARQKARQFAGMPVYGSTPLSLAWAPDGQSLALGGATGVKIWNAKTTKQRELRRGEDGVYAPLLWTQNGIWAAGGVYNPLVLRDPRTAQVRREVSASGAASERAHDGAVNAFQFYARGQKLWTLGGDDAYGIDIKRWDVAKNRVERTLKEVVNPRDLSLSPDEKTLAVAAPDGVAAFDSTALSLLWKADFGAPANDLTWSRDGKWLFITAEDGWTRVLNAAGQLERQFAALPAPAADSTGYEWVALDNSGAYLASKNAAPFLRWRDGETLSPLQTGAAQQREQLASLASPPRVASLQKPVPIPVQAPKKPVSPRKTAPSGPVLVLQGSTPSQPRALAVSNGGKWLVLSGPLTLLDGRSGLQWGKIGDDNQEPLLFTPDATRLFVSRPDYGLGAANRVQMIAIPSGKPLRAFPLPSAPLWSDGKRLRGLKNGRVIEFDLTTGKQRLTQALQSAPIEKRSPLRWEFSSNGAYVIEGSAGAIRWWRAGDGRLLGQIKDPLRAIGKTAISSDGKWLASEGDDPNWSPPTEAASEAAYARTFKIHVWNAATRKLFRTFEGYYSLSGGARLLRFSPDATTLLGAGTDSGLDRFRLKTDVTAPLPPAQKDFRRGLDWPIAVSNDGQWLGGAGQIYQSSAYAAGLQLWNIARSARQAIFAGTLRGADKVKWSPDGKFLAGGHRLTLWNAKTGQLLAEKPDSYLNTFRWRSNTLLESASLQFVNEWRVPDGQQRSQKLLSAPTKDERFGPYSNGANFSPDGQTFLTGDPKGVFGGGGNGLFVRDAQTFAVRREIKGFDTGSSELERIVWLPDSKHILHGTKTGFELIDLESGERQKQWNDPIDPKFVASGSFALTPLAVSGDGKLAAVRSTRDDSLLIYDLQTRAFQVQLVTKAGYQAQFLKDNRTVVAGGAVGLEWWDARGNGQKPLRVVRGATGFGWDISPDEKLIVFGTYNTSNQGVEIWNVARGERVLTLFLLGGNSDATTLDWIALTPQGFYDASPNGEKRLRWRQNDAFWTLQKSRARFKNPAKVREALAAKS